ncbi:MAG TPA: acylphosphatase [bacterium]|nr:acylphosphatase [bacterium]
MDVRAYILVSGVVQGVGFRFFVSRLAAQYGLNGWVRNLFTGEVEIEAEGPRGLILTFIAELKTGNPHARVQDLRVEWHSYAGRYQGFHVVY